MMIYKSRANQKVIDDESAGTYFARGEEEESDWNIVRK